MFVRQEYLDIPNFREVLGSGIGNWIGQHVVTGGDHIAVQLAGNVVRPDRPAAFHFAKDRETIIRFMRQMPNAVITSSFGALVVLEGRYGRDWDAKRVKDTMVTPFAKVAALGMGVGHLHHVSHIRLRDRGYVVMFAGRAAFTTPPTGLKMVAFNGYQATNAQIIASMG